MFDPQQTGIIHFEDIRLDQPIDIGGVELTADLIKDFARRYDPQPIHLDEEAAKQSIVGGLCASGFHTCCLMMRMLCDDFLLRTASLGAPGLEEVRWVKPVRPGMQLRVRLTAKEKRVMGSRPDIGLVFAQYDVLDQTGDVLMYSTCHQIIRLRDPKPKGAEPKRADKPNADAAPVDLWDKPVEDAPVAAGLYFEERIVGETRVLGAHTFERDAIIAFAKLYDPQPFHLSEDAGKASLFGGLAASGWHTACAHIRLIVADRQAEEAKLRAAGRTVPIYGPSPGFKNLRWIKPVMVGDTLEYRHRITGKVDLKSRPDRGMLQSVTQARNQSGVLVFEYNGAILAERLNAAR
jgi:acyl dehydratase